MAVVSGVPSSTSVSTESGVKPKELGQDEFLKLLVTQLKNQDPLKPMENASFIAELAQFSQLEQSTKQVKLLEQSIDSQTGNLRFSLLPLVGRDVRINGGVIQLGSGPAGLSYTLDRDAAAVHATILTPTNQPIRTLELGRGTAGNREVLWDGQDQNGNLVPPGVYRFAVSAVDTEGKPVTVTTTSLVKVSGVRMDNGSPVLLVGDQVVDPDAILEFR